jgi:hypothetical protein
LLKGKRLKLGMAVYQISQTGCRLHLPHESGLIARPSVYVFCGALAGAL